MLSATKKLLKNSLLLIVFIVSIFAISLAFSPKNASAATKDGWTINDPTGNVGSIVFDLSANPAIGNYSVRIFDSSNTQIYTSGALGSSGSPVTSHTWTDSVTDGTYTVHMWDEKFGSGSLVAESFSIKGGKVSATSEISSGTKLNCDPNQQLTTPRAVHDKILKIAICENIIDSGMFTWSQGWFMVDTIQGFVWGFSDMHPQTNKISQNNGAVRFAGSMVAGLYSPPFSGTQYLAQQLEKISPVKPAYAQGIGYSTLTPVQDIWEATRNVSYAGFIFIFVIVGFMIMFRAHISPQAVATVQDSLPRIVIALFLVTFSYAIAGFMIDLMFVFLNVIIQALPIDPIDANEAIFEHSVFGVLWGAWKNSFTDVVTALKQVIKDVVNIDLPLGINADSVLGWIGGSIAAIIVGIALIFVMIKIFFTLLTSYATIVVLTIAAPFFFLIHALPGNDIGKTWFKQMAANIAVFAVIAIIFLLAGMIGGIESLGGATDNPLIDENNGNVQKFPLMAGDVSTNALGQLIGVGLLLMAPGAAQMVKETLGAKGGGPLGASIGGALGAGAGVATALPRVAAREAGSRVGTRVMDRFVSREGPRKQQNTDTEGGATTGKGGPGSG